MGYINWFFPSFLIVSTDKSLVIGKVHLYVGLLLPIVLLGAHELVIHRLPASGGMSLTG